MSNGIQSSIIRTEKFELSKSSKTQSTPVKFNITNVAAQAVDSIKIELAHRLAPSNSATALTNQIKHAVTSAYQLLEAAATEKNGRLSASQEWEFTRTLIDECKKGGILPPFYSPSASSYAAAIEHVSSTIATYFLTGNIRFSERHEVRPSFVETKDDSIDYGGYGRYKGGRKSITSTTTTVPVVEGEQKSTWSSDDFLTNRSSLPGRIIPKLSSSDVEIVNPPQLSNFVDSLVTNILVTLARTDRNTSVAHIEGNLKKVIEREKDLLKASVGNALTGEQKFQFLNALSSKLDDAGLLSGYSVNRSVFYQTLGELRDIAKEIATNFCEGKITFQTNRYTQKVVDLHVEEPSYQGTSTTHYFSLVDQEVRFVTGSILANRAQLSESNGHPKRK